MPTPRSVLLLVLFLAGMLAACTSAQTDDSTSEGVTSTGSTSTASETTSAPVAVDPAVTRPWLEIPAALPCLRGLKGPSQLQK